ncbi:MAG: hypothetical protein AB7M12_13320 [Hyphomonadaceae bacterium]
MGILPLWAALVVAASTLLVVRNASQRELTAQLGLWGATYTRFLYGWPFALIWLAGIVAWRAPHASDWGGPDVSFALWVTLGAAGQAAATAGFVFAMRTRAFAVATAFTKTEALGSALVGMVLIHDVISTADWIGGAIGSLGIVLMAHMSLNRAALHAAIGGSAAGALFAVSSVAYRAATQAWGGDPWVAAAMTLSVTLIIQTLVGMALMFAFARASLMLMFQEWRPCLVPGAAGAISSALLFAALSIGPSTGAVKSVQLVDVVFAWGISRRLFREHIRWGETAGIALVIAGAAVVALL